jgi:hypothetical protein
MEKEAQFNQYVTDITVERENQMNLIDEVEEL